jgi:glycosyltransferase involved in cell wall biosynthesis
MPVRNEEHHLRAAVESILTQEYPRPFDVCLAIAPCTDRTDDVAAALMAEHPNVHIVANPGVLPGAALNAGFRATSGEVVVRCDGHAALCAGYIRRAVETMQRTGAVNVGGVQRAEGTTPMQRAIAVAMTSRFGVGGGRTHLGGAEGPVDSVWLGVFRRTAVEAAGMFDEHLRANEDYELNIRLRAAGGTVWFDPALWGIYRPRTSLGALWRQYRAYGRGKRTVLRRHPGSLKPRQAIPPLAVLGLLAAVAVSPLWPWALLVPAVYLLALVVASLTAAGGRSATALRLLVVYPTIQFGWAVGFLIGRHRR